MADPELMKLLEDKENIGVLTERVRIQQLILKMAESQDRTTSYGRVIIQAMRELSEQIVNVVPDAPGDAA